MPHTRKALSQSRVEQVKSLLPSGEGSRALLIIGDRWSFLILRDAFLGTRRFEDFRRRTGAARGTLTARLNTLIDEGIFYRSHYGKAANRLEYRLTEKGLALYSIALTLWAWESRWGGDEYGLPPRLMHRDCGKLMHPALVCSHCLEAVDSREVLVEIGPGAKVYAATNGEERRRRNAATELADGVDTTMFHSIDTIGDRWSSLLIAAIFLGLHRYDDIYSAMGIATNILADRLRRLLSAGVIDQHLYRDRPPRYEYRFTAKGWDLYPFVIALHDWASKWLLSPSGPALKLRHKPCGHNLRTHIMCDQCRQPVRPQAVTLRASRTTRAKVAPAKRRARKARTGK